MHHQPTQATCSRWRLLSWLSALCAVLAFLPSSALALEPEGINVGGLRMHPGAFLETAYDSNLFYTDEAEDELGGDSINAFSLRPGITFRVLTPDPGVADWRMGTRVSWEQYLDDQDYVLEQSGVEANVNTAVRLWPRGLLAVEPHFDYTRSNGPGDDYAQRRLSQHLIRPGILFELQPYEGKILSQKLGYDVGVRLFDDFESLNRFDHRFIGVTRWNFLPQTAATLELEQHIVTYPNGQRERLPGAPEVDLVNYDSTPFRGLLGVQGLLFRRVDFSAAMGYGWTGYEAGPNAHVLLGRAELGYRWPNNARLWGGYARNFQDSTFGNFYTYHEGYLRFAGYFIDRIRGEIGTRVLAQDFAPIDGFSERDDLIYEADIGASYFFIPGLDVSLNYMLRGNETDFGVVVGGLEATSSYIKHVVSLRLAYEY